MGRVLPVAAALLIAASAAAHDSGGHAPKVAGPVDGWVFPLAAPGTYRLPPIRKAADARLLDETGAPVRLAEALDGRLTLLAFVYASCPDLCPLASARMAEAQAMAAADPELAGRVRLATLSFDPERDTPEVMAAYADAFRDPGIAAPDWLFLTAPDEAEMARTLEAWDQPVDRTADEGAPFSHVLRVFLVDAAGQVRNIYSADFLDPRLVLNDLRTLELEEGRGRAD